MRRAKATVKLLWVRAGEELERLKQEAEKSNEADEDEQAAQGSHQLSQADNGLGLQE